jgi:hypothetical protein
VVYFKVRACCGIFQGKRERVVVYFKVRACCGIFQGKRERVVVYFKVRGGQLFAPSRNH